MKLLSLSISSFDMHNLLIKIYLYIFIICMLFIVIFNYIIDPYGIHQAFIIKGFNEYKPERYANTPQSKLINLLNIKPNTVILGTSRAEFGIDPDIIDWPIGATPVYNMALGLSSFREMDYIIDEISKVKLPSKLIIGIDFISFSNIKDKNKLRSVVQNTSDMNLGWSLLSFGALKASFETILSQKENLHVNYKYNGSRTSRSYDKSLEVESHRNLFDKINNRYNYRAVLSSGFHSDVVKSNFNILIKMLNKLRKKNVKVILFFSPIHSELLKQIYIQDAWNSFQEVKRKLTSIVSSSPLLNSIELWDFSLVNNITMEIPPVTVGKKMKWYYDSAHYKPSVGKLIFDDIFKKIETIGVILNKDNIEGVLMSQRKNLVAYVANK